MINGTERRRNRRRMQQRIREVVEDRRLTLALAEPAADPPVPVLGEPAVQAPPLAS